VKKKKDIVRGVGIDVAETARFRSLIKRKKPHLLEKMFSRAEREYCFSYADAAPHFAGTFAAKEAVVKARGADVPLASIEIRRQQSGKPEVWIKGRRLKSLLVSISHTRDIACAIAFQKNV